MKSIAVSSLLLLAALATSFAAPVQGVDRIRFANRQVVMLPANKVLMAPDTVAMPFSIVVHTNGTFTVNGGKARPLQEGDVLRNDGMLLSANGTITPVMDHVRFNRGRVLVTKDGVVTEATEIVRLEDGTTITPDGKITPVNGAARRLLDGEIFRPGGAPVPSRDTVTKQNGRVLVQKDGSTLSVDPKQSIMMNDGTKVFGDGTVLTTKGDRIVVAEGQTYVLQGVVTRPR